MYTKAFFLLVLLHSSVFSFEYAVVTNDKSQIQKLSVKQIKDIFTKKRNFINEFKIIPVNISASSKLRERFEQKILKTNREKINRYWIKQHFQGITPPIVQSSENSVKLFIKNVKGAIGYLPIYAVDSELKVLYEF